MWKHEILEGLYLPDDYFKNGPSGGSELFKKIQRSEVFYFGDYSKYEKQMPSPKDLSINTIPSLPYDSVIYEYAHTTNIAYIDFSLRSNVKTRTALMIEKITDNTINCIVFYSLYSEQFDKFDAWSLYPISIGVNAQNVENKNIQLFNVLGADTSEKEDDAMLPSLIQYYQKSCVFTDIINCQNVVTKTVEPPERLNQKRIRRGKLPLYTYKILEVVKGKPKSKDGGSVPWSYKSPESVRFHLCRGHFKTFSPDKPLFGKYSGTFWWHPQSRGDRRKGVVEKEYAVKQEIA